MSVTMKIEFRQIRNRFGRTAGRHFALPYEVPEALNDLHVHEVRHMKLVIVAKQTGLDSSAERSLQEELQQRRRVDYDHAESRSSRMTAAAGVFRVTRLRL